MVSKIYIVVVSWDHEGGSILGAHLSEADAISHKDSVSLYGGAGSEVLELEMGCHYDASEFQLG